MDIWYSFYSRKSQIIRATILKLLWAEFFFQKQKKKKDEKKRKRKKSVNDVRGWEGVNEERRASSIAIVTFSNRNGPNRIYVTMRTVV